MNTPPPLGTHNQAPPPLPPKKKKWSLVKILLVIFIAPPLIYIGLSILFAIIALIATSGDRESGELGLSGRAQFREANKLIISDRHGEYLGNTEHAESLAKVLSRQMFLARNKFFSESESDSISLTGGSFITYCYLDEDSCAFLVRVPELRHYTSDAKEAMADLAWSIAFKTLQDTNSSDLDLAVGIKGTLKYAQILVGDYKKDTPDPSVLVRERDITGFKQELFFPFFEVSSSGVPYSIELDELEK